MHHLKLILLVIVAVSVAPQFLRATPTATSTEPLQDLNILNYVMRPLRPTAFSANWELASGYSVPSGPWDSLILANQNLSSIKKLENVNDWINKKLGFASDDEQYQVKDKWVNINVSVGNGKGDCEDSAIAKMQLLKKLGFVDEQLFLVILFDQLQHEYHALLLVKIPEGVYVLDNKLSLMGKELQKDTELKDYVPLKAFTKSSAYWFGTVHVAAP